MNERLPIRLATSLVLAAFVLSTLLLVVAGPAAGTPTSDDAGASPDRIEAPSTTSVSPSTAPLSPVPAPLSSTPAASEPSSTASEHEGTIETDHFEIRYHDGYESEAETIASYADDYYPIPFQLFGVEPSDDRVPVVVGSSSDVPCGSEYDGCYTGPPATIYVTDDDRSLFYHEFIHRYQHEAGVLSPGGTSSLAISTEGGARYLDRPDDEIEQAAAYSIEPDRYYTARDPDVVDYADLALFPEYLLHEYGRDAFDVFYTTSWVWPGGGTFGDELEAATGEEYNEIRDGFADQFDDQERRMGGDGTTLPGFTYEPLYVTPDAEVTFDARTPAPIDELGRSWYPEEPSSYEWDLTGDGEIDATGPTVTHSAPNDTVTLYVTVDGETHEVEQQLLTKEPAFTLEGTDVSSGRIETGENVTVAVSVGNDGDAAGTERVELVANDEVIDAQTAEVAPGDTATVTFEPSFDDPGTYTLAVDGETVVGDEARALERVEVLEPANVTLVDAAASVAEARPDEAVTIDATLENAGEVAGETTLALAVDGDAVAERTVEVDPDGPATVSFDHAFDEPGTYNLTVGGGNATDLEGLDVGPIDVLEPAAISLANASLSTPTVETGESVTVEAVLENAGEVAGTTGVAVAAAEETVANRTVDVPGGETVSVTFEPSFDEAGTYDLTVDGEPVGTLEVTTPGTENGESDGDGSQDDSGETDGDDGASDDGAGSDGSPGFGAVAAAVALLSLGLWGRTRFQSSDDD